MPLILAHFSGVNYELDHFIPEAQDRRSAASFPCLAHIKKSVVEQTQIHDRRSGSPQAFRLASKNDCPQKSCAAEATKQNEPDAQAVHCYVSEKDNALYVRDEFKDAAALGLHLSSTASSHFPQLLAIAAPGPFFFHGDVPEELKQATEQMQLGAEFSTHAFGFDR